MAKFDVFANPTGAGFLLDVQTDLLGDLNTRMVVPLLPRSVAPIPAARLNPVFKIDGTEVVMCTQFMAAVPVGILKSSIENIERDFDKVTMAIDMLMQGF